MAGSLLDGVEGAGGRLRHRNRCADGRMGDGKIVKFDRHMLLDNKIGWPVDT